MIFSITKKCKRVPTIFISSTLKGVKPTDPGLKPYREKLCKMIKENFKWKCICSEESYQYFWGTSLWACLKAVEDSDLYIGIFWKRYGSIVIPHELSMTEFEFYRAMNLRKAMRIYIILDDSNYREGMLQLFLDFITSDHEIGNYVCFCKLSELEEKVKIDLDAFGKVWDSKKEISRIISPYYIDEALKRLGLLPFELPFLEKLSSTVRYSFDKEYVLEKLQGMSSSYLKYKFVEVLKNGWDVLNMLKLRPPGVYREYRTLWAEFLRLWGGACNWYGHIEGNLGSVWASKSLMEVYRLLEDWSQFHSSAGTFSSTLYTLAGIKEAKILGAFTRLKKDLEQQHKGYLKQALFYSNFVFAKSDRIETGILSVRGNIHRELSDYKSAIADFRSAIDLCSSKESRAHIIADLGLTQMLKGDEENGMNNLEEAKVICERQGLKSPWDIRVQKRFGEGLMVAQKWKEAEEEIKKAIKLSKQWKLGHQMRIAITGLQRIEKKK